MSAFFSPTSWRKGNRSRFLSNNSADYSAGEKSLVGLNFLAPNANNDNDNENNNTANNNSQATLDVTLSSSPTATAKTISHDIDTDSPPPPPNAPLPTTVKRNNRSITEPCQIESMKKCLPLSPPSSQPNSTIQNQQPRYSTSSYASQPLVVTTDVRDYRSEGIMSPLSEQSPLQNIILTQQRQQQQQQQHHHQQEQQQQWNHIQQNTFNSLSAPMSPNTAPPLQHYDQQPIIDNMHIQQLQHQKRNWKWMQKHVHEDRAHGKEDLRNRIIVTNKHFATITTAGTNDQNYRSSSPSNESIVSSLSLDITITPPESPVQEMLNTNHPQQCLETIPSGDNPDCPNDLDPDCRDIPPPPSLFRSNKNKVTSSPHGSTEVVVKKRRMFGFRKSITTNINNEQPSSCTPSLSQQQIQLHKQDEEEMILNHKLSVLSLEKEQQERTHRMIMARKQELKELKEQLQLQTKMIASVFKRNNVRGGDDGPQQQCHQEESEEQQDVTTKMKNNDEYDDGGNDDDNPRPPSSSAFESMSGNPALRNNLTRSRSCITASTTTNRIPRFRRPLPLVTRSRTMPININLDNTSNNSDHHYHPSSPASTPHISMQNNHHRSVSAPSVTSFNTIANNSYGDDSIVVNGKLIKCKRRGSVTSTNNTQYQTTVDANGCISVGGGSYNNNSVYEKAILARDTSNRTTITNSGFDSGDVPSLGHESSTTNNHPHTISMSTSTSACTSNRTNTTNTTTTTKRRRRKRRAMKEEFKFIMGKMVPGPLKKLSKSVLPKRRNLNLSKSKSGCLA